MALDFFTSFGERQLLGAFDGQIGSGGLSIDTGVSLYDGQSLLSGSTGHYGYKSLSSVSGQFAAQIVLRPNITRTTLSQQAISLMRDAATTSGIDLLFNGVATANGNNDISLRPVVTSTPGTADVMSVTPVNGTWYVIEIKADTTANPWAITWRMKPVGGSWTERSFGPANAAMTFSIGYLGTVGTAFGWGINFDQWAMARAQTAYIGEAKALSYLPDAVGTHNLDAATSLHFFKDISGTETALTNSETTSWQVLDDMRTTPDVEHLILRALAGAPGLPVHQATVSHTGNPTTAPTATLGTTAANDVLIAVVSSGGSNTIPTLSGTYNGGAWQSVDDSTLTTTGAVAVYWSRCTGNHTGQTIIGTTVDSGSLTVARYNNVLSTATPIGANKIEAVASNAANPGLSAFTTTTANSKVVLAVGADDNLAVITAASATSALTVRSAPASSGGADSEVGIADRDQATAGTTGAFTTTWGANAAGTEKYLLAFELLGEIASGTQPTNTWYTEHTFENSAEAVDPIAVRAVIAQRNDAGTTANSITAKVRANSNEQNIFSGNVGVDTLAYKQVTMAQAPGATPWTDTLFDGAAIRWGYSADADSSPRLESAMLMALFPIGGATTSEKTGALLAATAFPGEDAAILNRLGSIVSATRAIGADASEWSEIASLVARALIAGADMKEMPRIGSLVASAFAAGVDVTERSELGSLTPVARMAGADVATLAETGTLLTSGRVAGADVATLSELGALLASGRVAGVDSVPLTEEGSLVADTSLSGADVSTWAEMGSLVADTLLAGPGVKEGAGKAGTIRASALSSGTDSSQRAELGALIGGVFLAGARIREMSDTGSLRASALQAGAKVTEHPKAAYIAAQTLLAGIDATTRSEVGAILADTLLAGVSAKEGAGKSGALLSGSRLSGIKASEFPGSGSLVADTFGSGLKSRTVTRSGLIASSAGVFGADVFIAARSGSIISVGSLSAVHSEDLARFGSLIAQALVSVFQVDASGYYMQGDELHLLTGAAVEQGVVVAAAPEQAVLVVLIPEKAKLTKVD